MLLLWVTLLAIQQVHSDSPLRNCSTGTTIRGGHVTFSQGGQEGSVLTYHCGPGQYPFPVSFRTCSSKGQWSTMRMSNGRRVTAATCKDVMCPAQLQLDNGDFWPRDQWFRVGAVQTFFCEGGFTLHGSAQRNCTISGEWTGTTPICQDYVGDCDDPGTPPGAQMQRFSGQYLVGDRVTYRCQTGLELLGSAQRECLQHRRWSGSKPRCQSSYMFDSPTAVAAAMTGSLAGVMDVLSPDSIRKASYQRTIDISKDSRLNVFILLDTSGSISEADFELSREAAIALIRKLEAYEVQIRYHVLSFASEVIDIVNINNIYTSAYGNRVISVLQKFDPKAHGDKKGTNLYAALARVNGLFAFLKKSETSFNETQNIIVLATDGYSNVGNHSSLAMKMIRSTLRYNYTAIDHTDERLLDVYVFGIGPKVKKSELNILASKKRDEEHLFVLEKYSDLAKVFNKIISDKTVTLCGVAQETEEGNSKSQPWHVSFSGNWTALTCSGSIVSPNWVLTAAHCFGKKASGYVPQTVTINYGEGKFRTSTVSKRVIMHPNYNSEALKNRKVKEFYDYDVALVELQTPIPLSWSARPICLPCTVPASRAMKNINFTCEQHSKELIPRNTSAVFFIHKVDTGFERKETHIHTGNKRAACVAAAQKTLRMDANVTLEEYVPERLLCSGGTPRKQDKVTCKGDSGGSVFLENRKRYFQVGVVSWGTDSCTTFEYDDPPQDARDFHINVFKIISWLKIYLSKDLQFLSDVDKVYTTVAKNTIQVNF